MTDINTEKVIIEVSSRPVLWDATCCLYKNREARQAAWTAICNELIENFSDLDVGEQRTLELKIQQRWRTARDCYVKMKSSQFMEGSKKCKPYAHSELLKFLDPTLRYPVRTHDAALAQRAEWRRKYRANKMLHDKINIHQTAQRRQSNMRQDNSTMSLFEKHLLTYLKKDDSPLETDDNDFFKSLGPILKGFDSGQKLLFRSRVLATALDIQNDLKRSKCVASHSGCGDHTDDSNPLESEPFEKKYRPPVDEKYSSLYIEAERIGPTIIEENNLYE